jgi:hypothetical protein
MSEHATAAHAATQRARAERRRVEAVADRGTWPLAVIVFASVVAAYAAIVGAIYLLVTSVNGQLLAAGGLLILLFNFVLLFVLLLRTMGMDRTRHARATSAQRDG